MARTAELRSCTISFDADGNAHLSAVVLVRDSVVGDVVARNVELTDPAMVAAARAVVTGFASPIETDTGLPLSIPAAPGA